jgi:beta-glucosidase
MNIKHITLACAVLIAMPLMAQKKATTKAVRKQTALPVYKQATQPIEARVADLLSRMTVEEKVGQLICPLGWEMYTKTGKNSVEPSALFKQKMNEVPIGSFWAVLRADPWTQKTLETGLNPELSAKAINALQRYAVEQTRLGIPILFAEECPHGHMAIGTTVFPTSLTAASTWNPSLLYDMGSAIGLEAAAQGSNIGYGPVLDVAREPRWSRMEETFGEDPWLTSVLGTAVVRGMQGDDTADKQHVICTLKHLAAYGVPEGGHNGGPVYAGERLLRSQLLLPFEKAVKAGAGTVMTSYNSIDGIPCTSNRHLLTDMLRGEWGFNGFVYSDLLSVDGIAGMGAAANNKEAAVLALKAGLDMDLGGGAFGKNLKKALDEGLITMADLDRAVSNVLAMKFRLGLFDNPYVQPKRAREVCRSTEHKKLAQKVAEEGTVLLKNDGILPLSRTMKRIAVIGPNADMPYNQLGDYTAPQPREEISTVLDGIRSVAGSNVEVVYERGCAIRDTTSADIPAAVRAAEGADAVVLVVGGSSARDFKTKYIATGAATVDESKTLSDMECGEGFDRATLSLLGKQEQLIEAVAKTGKPLVIVYIEGRPLLMNRAAEVANALLTAWYPGEQGGKAIASILFGDVNPSGRLPVSIPRSVGQLPVYYSQNIKRDYMDEKGAPLYPFGYGLSYTQFAYSDLTITPNAEPSIMPLVEPLTVSLSEGSGAVRVSLTVKNTGDCSGHEVVQLYLSDRAATVSQPPLQLRAFKKVCLDAGESQRIEFTLGFDELSLINQEMKRVVEPGEFEVLVGASSSDIRLKEHFVVTR